MSEGMETPTSPSHDPADEPKRSRIPSIGVDDAATIAKDVATGAAAGGGVPGALVGAGKGLVKVIARDPKKRKAALTAVGVVLAAFLIIPLCLVIVITLALSGATAMSQGASEYAQTQRVDSDTGLSADDLNILMAGASLASVDWHVLAAIHYKQQSAFGGQGPFHISGDAADKVGGAGANDLAASALFVAVSLRELLDQQGADRSLDIANGATLYGGTTIVWADEDQHRKQIEEPYTAALVELPLEGVSTEWGAYVIWAAIQWRLGLSILCTPSSSETMTLVDAGNWVSSVTGTLGTGFGPVRDGDSYTMHTGQDVRATAGSTVSASSNGTVTQVGDTMIVQHDGGITSRYVHVKATVQVGATVTGGQAIGTAAADLVRFEIWINARPTDPVTFLKVRGVTLGKPVGATSSTPSANSTTSTTDNSTPTGTVPDSLTSTLTSGTKVTLNAAQLKNSSIVIGVGKSLNLDRYIQAALMTIFVETGGLNLASEAVPESKNYPHDGVAKGDLDSVGLFQQRTGWGSVKDRMDPVATSKLFFAALVKVNGRETMPLGRLAQAVQISAFPDRYALWENVAADIMKVVTGAAVGGDTSPGCDTAATSNVLVSGDWSEVIQFGLSLVGKYPYAWGGGTLNGPSGGIPPDAGIVGFDCSSFVRYIVYQKTGIDLSRTSRSQAAFLQSKGFVKRSNNYKDLQAGDIVFYSRGDSIQSIYHVALVVAPGEVVEEPGRHRYVQHNKLVNRMPGDIWGFARFDLNDLKKKS